MKKLFIFDLDGTVVNTLESLAYSVNTCLNQLNLPSNPEANYKYYCGEGGENMMKRSLIDAGDTELVHFDKAMSMYHEVFLKGCTYHIQPYDGIMETLNSLKTQGIKIAVLTNKAHVNAVYVLNHVFGENFFDMILGQRDDHQRKPSPEGVFLILNQFGFSPSECVYSGDTATDMQTGTSAGLLTIGVSWGFRTKEELIAHQADHIISHPSELLEFTD